ncbi:MAG: hypothetical protein A2268_16840 [Candidatus Raymondbacteria bacterium RifOxyA12_full_50_37]|uniref:CopG family transcriptional regulator n=1 Tax=Candidatus Raymondbacteria bacterium RIFOXYD12_FULL_49_13 TaxID=1817890 RepID=A0A1F7FCY7_UNCRA|nr:MAG: hypothetical protein A2268_16840 [Candidatus Raymondbacteria bacterium RifOxyA12_full_50_37]OGJ86277.1 MAG: hypothetical protein A2248_16435 [Candidatus Raymondbacteria bacterium RIFOXYA2_FULL_49_16]OGJ93619.1 MAG: hypothetical protein A2487_20175 [Candidatus Raymondbacteria bacterium RifOxyC12_full_50_8]OGJ95814.1 MAG: hypothetical protein A2453_11750 [Candidatus Raymondbacteria bacterium RIFOXYC2_FULL_50_21]OGJ99055.1 MAG: hypothetical protein A2350_17330 [Candidatus Raymondbacteria b
MSKNKGYSEAPPDVAAELERSVTVKDFLPSPDEIAAVLKKEETIPVTMKLKKRTVERYKRYAREKGIKYQTFVSAILDNYARNILGR